MRVAFHSKEMVSLSWARRMQDEGCEVLVYSPPNKERAKPNRKIGDGIVNKAISREQWLSWGMSDPQTLWFFDCTDHGELADRLRSTGKLVVGGGSFMDRLENDRAFGTAFAQQCGIQIPPERRFTTISAAMSFLKSNPKQLIGDGGWAWKPNQDLGCGCTIVARTADEALDELGNVQRRLGDSHTGIVQERIKGVALSTNRWYNGRAFVGPYIGTIEEKKLMNDDLGPSTGCSLDLGWFYREELPKAAQALRWPRIEAAFRAANAPPGLYDINAVHNRSGAWVLEWTPRLGIDSELVSQRGISNLSQFLWALATGGDVDKFFDIEKTYMGIRLSVPPYPNDDFSLEKSPAMGIAVRGVDGLWARHFVAVGIAKTPNGFEVADPFGFVGTVVTSGTDIDEMNDELLAFCKKLEIRDLQYRTDAAAIIGKDLDDLATSGWRSTPVLEDAA